MDSAVNYQTYLSPAAMIRSMTINAVNMEFPAGIIYSGPTTFGHLDKWLFKYKRTGEVKGNLTVVYTTPDESAAIAVTLNDRSDIVIVARQSGSRMIVDDIVLRGRVSLKSVEIIKRP